MRRFALRPITFDPPGFAQTLIIPPAPSAARVQSAPEPGNCDDVEPLPDAKIAWAYDECAGANKFYFAVVLSSDSPTAEEVVLGSADTVLPAGYTMISADPESPETVPSTGDIRRACDNAVTSVPAVYVGAYTC
jgi:hypothetical protein